MNEPDKENETAQTGEVAGRRPGSGRGTGVPRGVEVLLKKASVDDEFRELLLAERASAASSIGLELDPAERAMLDAISREQLESIVARTVVPAEQRRVFLGRLAAPMLAVLGIGIAGCSRKSKDSPSAPQTRGIQPDRP